MAIVTDRPIILLSAIRREWKKLERNLEIRRASLLTGKQKVELTKVLQRMYSFTFSNSNANADVFITTALTAQMLGCKALYFYDSNVTIAALEKIFATISDKKMLVVYYR